MVDNLRKFNQQNSDKKKKAANLYKHNIKTLEKEDKFQDYHKNGY